MTTDRLSEVPVEGRCTDFGGVRHGRPDTVLVTGSGSGEAQALMTSLGRRGAPVTLRGAGHSCDGQTVTDGTLLEHYRPDEPARAHVVDREDGLIEVPAWLSWHQLERELNDRGRAIPVLTDYLHLSVGGTLSVGGMGLNSVEHGLQTDQVAAVRLVDGYGTPRWCSLTDHPELLRFALGGLGSLGLIDRVILHTVPYQRYAHLHRTKHASFADLTRFALSVTAEKGESKPVQHYNAYVSGDQLHSEYGWFQAEAPAHCGQPGCTVVEDLPFALHNRRRDWIAAFPHHLRMWTDYVLPPEQFGEFAETVDALRSQSPLASHLKAMYVLIIRRPADAVPFAFAPTQHRKALGVGLYIMADKRDPTAIGSIRRTLRRLLTTCCDLGGRPYLYGVNPLTPELLKRLYGADLDRLRILRSTYGLHHINARVWPHESAGDCK
ncbi:FAD-binding oxidoreductase [Streptomyces sirii]|uniref:FAD-binding oxidoreductase n=1 Tax=Streptomyces sirii TaxID=3127701 RepID=UPI003D3614A4